MNKWDVKKEQKKQVLFNTAYDLFVKNGFNNTTISDIVNKAGLAKGTFYLYFKDKFDLRDKIIIRKTYEIINNAVEKVPLDKVSSFIDRLLLTLDYIIDYLESDVALVRFINKNLIFGIYKRAFSENIFIEGKKTLYELFIEGVEEEDYKIDNPEIVFCIIIELISSTCYSSIVLSEPAPIETMKPYIHNSIKSILDGYKI